MALRHPFDDRLFAAMCAERGIARDDLPTHYNPGKEWGNDGITTDLPGMPPFNFIAGDADWFGVITLDVGDARYQRYNGRRALMTIDHVMPATMSSALIGERFARVADHALLDDAIVEHVQPDDDDPDMTEITLALPKDW